MILNESSLFASFNSINRYSARDIADLTFLYLVSLHVLRSNWETATFAKTYANKTLSWNDWDIDNINGTDLYQLLSITLYHSEKFMKHIKDLKSSETLLHDLLLNSYDVKQFLRNITSSTYSDSLSSRLLLKFERDLRISVSNYKSVRRICSDWNSSHIDHEAKSLAVTRLIQALNNRAFRGDLIKKLQELSSTHNLEISNACNPETGKNCNLDTSKKLSMLKKLAIVAGLSVGAYQVGKALVGGFKNENK